MNRSPSPPVASRERASADPREDRESILSVRPNGTVLLLVAASADRDWAARTALEISGGWAEEGMRIVLADLHLESPLLLSDPRTEDMAEGIVDIFLYGASLSRIARPIQGGRFYLIPAGTYAPDPGEIFRNPRWKKLVAGFRDTGATLLLLVPSDNPELGELAAWSKEAILLGSERQAEVASLLATHGISTVAMVAPDVESRPSPGESVPGVASAGSAVTPDAPLATAVPESDANAFDPDLPPPPPRPRPNRTRHVVIGILLLVAVVLITLYIVSRVRPEARQGAEESSQLPSATALNASPEGDLLPYSVQVKAFTSLSAARAQLGIEEARLADARFFISPEEIQGVVYYRILAGQLPDTLAAVALRDRLIEAGSIDDADAIAMYGQLQHTPLAYDLGEYATAAEARARVDSLGSLEIPSYPVLIPYSDGTQRWRVYGGAYQDSDGAARMRALLDSAGVTSQLTVRAGLQSAEPE